MPIVGCPTRFVLGGALIGASNGVSACHGCARTSEKDISLAAGVVGIRGRMKGLGVTAVEAEAEVGV
jgi:hypothetical protein